MNRMNNWRSGTKDSCRNPSNDSREKFRKRQRNEQCERQNKRADTRLLRPNFHPGSRSVDRSSSRRKHRGRENHRRFTGGSLHHTAALHRRSVSDGRQKVLRASSVDEPLDDSGTSSPAERNSDDGSGVAGARTTLEHRANLRADPLSTPPPSVPSSSATEEKPSGLTIDGEVVPFLDEKNPEHARRLRQRRRMIAYGKNTAGYDEYIRRVPRHKRKSRSMEHPSTPEVRADIPTRRFQGMVRAWRRSLHKYDPPDLIQSHQKNKDCAVTSEVALDIDKISFTSSCNDERECVKTKQLEEAARQGLQVQFSDSPSEEGRSGFDVNLSNVLMPMLGVTTEKASPTTHSGKKEKDDTFGMEGEDESDDDLL